MTSTMTDDLRPSSLFDTVNRVAPPKMRSEPPALLHFRALDFGEHYRHLQGKDLLSQSAGPAATFPDQNVLQG
ncbi:hypothetical protein E4L95_12515 [Paracoccus liaowanqingii]|uniref:Uncharacterized protein n=1 Tax=Paracoccus liaowanqingii TaxID=2560053 RepID=A0A4Z1CFR2_9RHOB|nr:hypothetical protein [Paracoccus liaowanqingii]TGN58375.1 hypothetical protein E4L95_12515 [Paracoccus liaowanqingii]